MSWLWHIYNMYRYIHIYTHWRTINNHNMYCTIILPCTNLYRNLQCFHQLVKSKSSFIKLSVNTSHTLTTWQMHCWKAVRMTAQIFKRSLERSVLDLSSQGNETAPAKGQTFVKKQLWSLWYVWMREDFCIIIFSLSFNATSVMASRDACETKSVSLQISLLATVPCLTWTLSIL